MKARRPDGRTGPADEALTPAKLRRVGRAADLLLLQRGQPHAARDLLGAAVDLGPDGSPTAVRFVPVEETR